MSSDPSDRSENGLKTQYFDNNAYSILYIARLHKLKIISV